MNCELTTTKTHELYPIKKKSVRGPAGAEVPTPTHTGALDFRACLTLPPHVLDLMRTERAHFYPQHWLLCQMGLY